MAVNHIKQWKRKCLHGVMFVLSPVFKLPGIVCQYVKSGNFDLLLLAGYKDTLCSSSYAYMLRDICVEYRKYPAEVELKQAERAAVEALFVQFARTAAKFLDKSDKIVNLFTKNATEILQYPFGDIEELSDLRCCLTPLGSRKLGVHVETAQGVPMLDCVLAPRKPGQPGVLEWSVRVSPVPKSGDFDQRLVDFLLVKIAACLSLFEGPKEQQLCPEHTELLYDLTKPPKMGEEECVLAHKEVRRRIIVRLELPGQCSEKCIFCFASKDKRIQPISGIDAEEVAFARAEKVLQSLAQLRGSTRTIELHLSGRDALSFSKLDQLLSCARSSGVASVFITAPPTQLENLETVKKLASCNVNLRLITTIHGPNAIVHDKIAGHKGAFQTLISAIDNCGQAGIPLELNHVLVKANYGFLSDTLKFVKSLGLPLRVYAFSAETTYSEKFVKRNIVQFTKLAAVFDRVASQLVSMNAHIHNFPMCQVPPRLRHIAMFHASAYRESGASVPDACTRCSVLASPCTGPDSWYVRLFGTKEFTPL